MYSIWFGGDLVRTVKAPYEERRATAQLIGKENELIEEVWKYNWVMKFFQG